MSRFVLEQTELAHQPFLVTIAYGSQSQTGRRRWDQIIGLPKYNLWLIFAMNVFVMLFVIAGEILVLKIVTTKHLSIVTFLPILVLISAPIKMCPDIIKLGNILRAHGYTAQKQSALAAKIIEEARTHKQQRKGCQ